MSDSMLGNSDSKYEKNNFEYGTTYSILETVRFEHEKVDSKNGITHSRIKATHSDLG